MPFVVTTTSSLGINKFAKLIDSFNNPPGLDLKSRMIPSNEEFASSFSKAFSTSLQFLVNLRSLIYPIFALEYWSILHLEHEFFPYNFKLQIYIFLLTSIFTVVPGVPFNNSLTSSVFALIISVSFIFIISSPIFNPALSAGKFLYGS